MRASAMGAHSRFACSFFYRRQASGSGEFLRSYFCTWGDSGEEWRPLAHFLSKRENSKSRPVDGIRFAFWWESSGGIRWLERERSVLRKARESKVLNGEGASGCAARAWERV